MPICLFCLRDDVLLTDEHLFPAALGGNIVVEGSVCADCNHGFSKFEQPLACELAPLRLLLKIPDRYGRVPEVAATARTKDREYEARIKNDGSVQLKPIVTVVRDNGVLREIVFQFATERQKETLRREAAEKGFQFFEGEPGEGQQAEVHVSGNLQVIGSNEGLRTAAKIANMTLAYRTGCRMALNSAFNRVRDYVRTGDGHPCARLFVHHRFLGTVETGPHQHSVILAGRRDKNRVDAIVRLFGGLAYFVALSDAYDGADFFDTLVYDAYRGEIDGMLFSHEQAEFLQTEDVATSGETIWSDVAASGEWFCNFLDRAISVKLMRDTASKTG